MEACMLCTIAEYHKAGGQALVELVNLKRTIFVVAFDTHTTIPKTRYGNVKVTFVIYLLAQNVCAVPISGEKVKMTAQDLLER